jgi:hypothetical protein
METRSRFLRVPSAVPAAMSAEMPHELDMSHTLTSKQYRAWRTFGPEWDDFRQAWLRRGFRLPPSGREDELRTQRTLLSEVLWSRPRDLVLWVGEAPGRTSYEVVGFVLKRWHETQDVAANFPPSHQPTRSGSPLPIGALLPALLARIQPSGEIPGGDAWDAPSKGKR